MTSTKFDFLSKTNMYWLGACFLSLAVFALFIGWIVRRPQAYNKTSGTFYIPDIAFGDPDSDDIFVKTNFQKVQENYQRAYLDLVNKISETNTLEIDVTKNRNMFENYDMQQRYYLDARKQVIEYERVFKERCFRQMRTLIQGILMYDSQTQTRMMNLDLELLVKVGALDAVPECPRGGVYRIITRSGRRTFNCSIHGTLKN